ncbi:hypothetical protein EII42_12185 [Tessaracoccus sp. OH4464_COT-324]|nr:hypothetical protein EII42_12185 [Tessaracoccus sp. OH4464_COT-324]
MRTHEEGVNATEILRALANQNDLSIAYSNATAAALRAAVAVFVYHREAPAKLQAEYDQWLEASKILNDIAKSLPLMEKVPGWSGPAADEYTEMAGVQTQASLELAALTTVVLETYKLAIQVNVTMAAYEYLCQVVERAEADNYTPSAPECYGPTKRLTQLMANAMDEICALEGKIGQTQQHLNEDITAAQNALRVYVDSIWPHGTAKAGVKAGNILGLRPTPPMDISDKLDDPDAQGNLRRNR